MSLADDMDEIDICLRWASLVNPASSHRRRLQRILKRNDLEVAQVLLDRRLSPGGPAVRELVDDLGRGTLDTATLDPYSRKV